MIIWTSIEGKRAGEFVNMENKNVLKKVETKMLDGPVVKRAALGAICSSRLNVEKTELNDKTTKPLAKQTLGWRKNGKAATERPKVKELVAAKKQIKSQSDVGDMEVESDVTGAARLAEKDNLVELSNAFSSKLLSVVDIDATDQDNPQLVSEYVNDIYAYMRELEATDCVQQKFLEGGKITRRMRSILVNWLIQVHDKFALLQETLYLTVAILDRYLQFDKTLQKSELQLVGVTAMLIASKYEEMYCPEISDFSYITENSFTNKQIRLMEVKMLKALNYNVSHPLPVQFLRRNSKAGSVDMDHHNMAKFFMELCFTCYEMSHYKPSEVAAASLYLAIKVRNELKWCDTLAHYSTYSEQQIHPIVCQMAKVVYTSADSPYQSVRAKYQSKKFCKLSKSPLLESKVMAQYAAKAPKTIDAKGRP